MPNPPTPSTRSTMNSPTRAPGFSASRLSGEGEGAPGASERDMGNQSGPPGAGLPVSGRTPRFPPTPPLPSGVGVTCCAPSGGQGTDTSTDDDATTAPARSSPWATRR